MALHFLCRHRFARERQIFLAQGTPFAAWFLLLASLVPLTAFAGGPRYVAGVTYFNPAAKGQPIHWAAGQLTYFVDQGPLGPLSNSQATAMVDAAAAIWNTVPTAAVNLVDQGALAEDVSGSNVLAGQGVFLQPADITPGAATTPVAVIYDSDGSVLDALEGTGASQPDACQQNGVLVWIDAMNPDATFGHAVILLNGRCATSASLVAMMSYEVERAFGRVLGLDYSQVNDGALTQQALLPNGTLAWPIMQPVNALCGASGGSCLPSPVTLRLDDVAALNRLYPVTSANLGSFPGKSLTASSTVSIQGTIAFRSGVGMQGVNVVVRPLDTAGKPLYAYTVTAVSGVLFGGNHGNAVTGWTDSGGNRMDRFGSDDPALQGFFDVSGLPLPPGMTSATYQVTFEPINPLYMGNISVGPYLLGSPTPSGKMPTLTVNGLHAGSAINLAVAIPNSAAGMSATPIIRGSGLATITGSAGPASAPTAVPLPPSGQWTSRLGAVGSSDWFLLPVRANRMFTVITQALGETGAPSASKAMPAIGVWDGFAKTGSAPAGWAPAGNGYATGETWLEVATSGNDIVRLAVSDQRGDGRPDYVYRGWVVYADTVSPSRLPLTGGTIVIRGIGFRSGDTVLVGGVPAQIVSVMPNQIIATVGAAPGGTTGSLDVEVVDLPLFNASAVIPGGVSYEAAANDTLSILTAPANQVFLNVPQAFTVVAAGADGKPAGGVTVQYSLTSGTAALACGQAVCSTTTGGNGIASLNVTATSTLTAVVAASLANGAGVQAHFSGTTPPTVTALTPTIYLAAGATAQWPVQELVQIGGVPTAGQQVTWQGGTGIVAPSSPGSSGPTGLASATMTVGPLVAGQSAIARGCVGAFCASFSAFGARAEYAGLVALAGVKQTLPVTAAPTGISMRVLDMNGHALARAAVTVSQTLSAWTPPCPAHGRCAQPTVLARQTSSLTSTLDGTIAITPLTRSGTATVLLGVAASGNSAILPFRIESHP